MLKLSMSFRRITPNPKHLKAKSKGNVKDISRFLLERRLRGLPEATPNGSV